MLRRPRLAACVLSLALAGCSAPQTPWIEPGAPAISADQTAASDRFDAAVRAYFDERFRWHPTEATGTGVHAYDDALDELSPEAVGRYVVWLTRWRDTLDQLLPSLPERRPSPPTEGSDRPALDARLLRDQLELERLSVGEWREHADSPSEFHQLAADAVYGLMVREFAPLEQRIANATARVRAIPAALQAGERWLEHPPKLAVEVALREVVGSLEMIRDVFPTFADRSADPQRRQAARQAAGEAVAALERHRTFLETVLLPRATGDYHDGRARWTQRAALGEGATESPEAIRDGAHAELLRLQAELRQLSARVARPGEDLAAVLGRLRAEHPTPDKLLDTYRGQQDAIRAFVLDHHLVGIDRTRDDLVIEETPGFLRATIFAALSSPGGLETQDRRTIFFVTPADTTRPQDEIDAYLTEHSNAAIVVTSIHEAYPGHHIQGIHQRNAHSLARRLLWYTSYGEGWAHYTEQMMVDEGFGDDLIKLDQRQEALLRAARAYLDPAVHVFGMTYEDAVKFYREEAFMSQPGAEMEARRVCLNPGTVFGYTYGKLAIYRLWGVLRARGLARARFHDALLDFGTAPIPVVSRALFGVELPAWKPGEVPR